MKNIVNFEEFDNSWYSTERSLIIRSLWVIVGTIFFRNNLFPFYLPKVFLLKIFGAKIGNNCVIKPHVNIKYPWNLEVGNNVWIGEQAWIDNLAKVLIGNNVCISQGALLISGNHDYKKIGFNLITAQIILEDGVWICAKSIVGPGVICRTHSILCLGSVANKEQLAYGVYKGNPAIKIKNRILESGD
jgi:putative colanic acid biosynthesis acetyltransferase WcaF